VFTDQAVERKGRGGSGETGKVLQGATVSAETGGGDGLSESPGGKVRGSGEAFEKESEIEDTTEEILRGGSESNV